MHGVLGGAASVLGAYLGRRWRRPGEPRNAFERTVAASERREAERLGHPWVDEQEPPPGQRRRAAQSALWLFGAVALVVVLLLAVS